MRYRGAHLAYWIALVYALVAATHSRVLFDVSGVGGESTIMSKEAETISRMSYDIRRAAARWLLLRADDYMHADAIEVAAPPQPGEKTEKVHISSFRWSREIIPALRLAVLLDPHFTEAMLILGPHLARDFGQVDEGIRMIQNAIQENRDHPLQFRYYGEIGRIYQDAKLYATAATYFKKALETARMLGDEELMDRYRLSVEQEDLFYKRAYTAYLTECAFRAGDFDTALRSMRQWEEQPRTNRFVRFLEQYERDKRVASHFDPNAYLTELSRDTAMAASASQTNRFKGIEPKKVEESFALEGDPRFWAKMKVLALVPLLFILYSLMLGAFGRRGLWSY